MKKYLIGTLLLLSLVSNSYADSLSTTVCPGAGCQTINVGNSGSIGVQITGTWSGTITFRASVDNSTYVSALAFPSNSTTAVTTTTGNGTWVIPAAGYSTVRVVFTSYMSGTATVNLRSAQYSYKSSGGGGMGSGTVTSIDTSSPITGGPITDSGSIECPTCAVTSGTLAQFAATTSAQLAGVISNETGTGVLVFNTSPTFVTPTLGAASATTLDTGQGANELFDMDQNVLTTSDVVFNLVSFLVGDGLSFAGGGAQPTTVTGGTLDGSSSLVLDQGAGYLRISMPSFTDITAPQGWAILESSDYGANYFGTENASGGYIINILSTAARVLTNGLHIFAANTVAQTGQVFGEFIEVTTSEDALNVYSSEVTAEATGTAELTDLGNYIGVVRVNDTASVDFLYGQYFDLTKAAGATVDRAFANWSGDMMGQATNPYYLWYDGGSGSDCNDGGVFRVNGFGIMAYYNPCFAKYVPAAVNFERIITRWGDTGVFGTDNIAYIGVEVGGTGTNRALELIGGALRFNATLVTPASSGTRFLCISTAGVVTSSASACSGT